VAIVKRSSPVSEPEPDDAASQVLEVVTGVRLDAVRGVVVVRDPAEEVEKFSGRRWEGRARVVVGDSPNVTEGAADRDSGGSAGGPWLRHAGTAPCSGWRIGASLATCGQR
jgi:hypothetical protein